MSWIGQRLQRQPQGILLNAYTFGQLVEAYLLDLLTARQVIQQFNATLRAQQAPDLTSREEENLVTLYQQHAAASDPAGYRRTLQSQAQLLQNGLLPLATFDRIVGL